MGIRKLLLAALLAAGVAAPLEALDPVEIRISPALPGAGDVVSVFATISLGCHEPTFAAPRVAADTVLLHGTYPSVDDCAASIPREIELPVGPLPAGEYRLQVDIR